MGFPLFDSKVHEVQLRTVHRHPGLMDKMARVCHLILPLGT